MKAAMVNGLQVQQVVPCSDYLLQKAFPWRRLQLVIFLPRFPHFFSFFATPSYLTLGVILSVLVLTLSCYLVSFSCLIYFVFLPAAPFVLAVVFFSDTAVGLHPAVVAAAEKAVTSFLRFWWHHSWHDKIHFIAFSCHSGFFMLSFNQRCCLFPFSQPAAYNEDEVRPHCLKV